MEALTYDRAVELAREVVAEFGEDYVYPESVKVSEYEATPPTCVYVHDDKPSCLVGQILHKYGVSLEALSLNEFRGAWTVSGTLADADDKARFFLSSAQDSQDKGEPWGTAVEFGLSQVKTYYK